jgi:hypothetical protein
MQFRNPLASRGARGVPAMLALVLAASAVVAVFFGSADSRAGGPLPAPKLLRPAADAVLTDTTPTFGWSSVRGAAGYRFQLSEDPSFGDTLLSVDQTRRAYTPKTPLTGGAGYAWRVGALSGDGSVSWSDVRTFSLVATPDASLEQAALSPTATRTPIPTRTAAPTKTAVAARTPAPTRTATPTAAAPSTRTPTPTRTPTATRTATATGTSTRTATPTNPATRTSIPTATATATATKTGTATRTPVPTATRTATPINSPTATKTPVRTATPTQTATASPTPSSTPTSDPIPTDTAVPTPTATGTATPSSTATATPTASSTATPTGTATASPTFTPTGTPTATATTSPVVGGLARNPSFESGSDYWYLEDDTQVVPTKAHGGRNALRLAAAGGYVDQHITLLSGNTYRLSVWGELDGVNDVGYVGVVYRDALGQRLTDLEPPMLRFTESAYIQQSMTFTVPASASDVAVFAWKRSGAAAFQVDDYYLVQQASPLPAPAVGPATGGCQRLLAPAYFYPPTGLWNPLIDEGSGVAMIILNVDSGVDTQHDWQYDAPLAKARAQGVLVIGYIATGFGTRDPQEVMSEMDRYAEWYGVTSFFLDEGDDQAKSLPLYTEMADHAHAMGGIVVINFGYRPDPTYMTFADIAIVFEGSLSNYENYTLPSWLADYPSNRFAEIVYDVPANMAGSVLARVRANNVGYVWITDDNADTGSPYDSLPSYWSSLNQQVDATCR